MIIYEASFNPMTEESCYGSISLHTSKEGAEKALKEHQDKEKAEFDALFNVADAKKLGLKWDDFKAWHVFELELLD
jgi:hypothetical protein